MTNFRSAAIATGNQINDSAYDNVKIVADSIESVNTVGSAIDAGAFDTVSANVADVNIIADNIASVLTTAGIAVEVQSVSANKVTLDSIYADKATLDSIFADKATLDSIFADKATLGSLFTDKAVLDSLYADKIALDRIYASIDSVDINVNNIANINIAADNISDVNAVGINIASINTVANVTNLADIVRVADDLNSLDINGIADVTVVANDLVLGVNSNINKVSADLSNVNVVAGAITNVNAVATNVADINTVATNIIDVGITAGSIADVSNVSANMADVNIVAGMAEDLTGAINAVALINADVLLTHADVVTTNNTVATIANGRTWFFGAVDPTTDGIDGDMAYNTVSTEVFKKVTGTWTSQGLLTGPQGIQGIQGLIGLTGETGNGIASVALTNTVGNTKTYTITFTDTSTTTFDVTNGLNGTNGVDGQDVDHVSKTSGTGAAGTADTYTVWIDAGETISAGTFTVYNGADGLGSGDMLKVIYDPTNINASVFDVDNHISGTTNKVYTAIEKAKLSSIEENATADQTGAEIKSLYEAELDTNAFTDYEKSKLADTEVTSQLAARDAANRNRDNHIGTQLAATISDFDTAVTNSTQVLSNTTNKVDKVAGKQLSTEDYLTAEKTLVDVGTPLNTTATTLTTAINELETTKIEGITAGTGIVVNGSDPLNPTISALPQSTAGILTRMYATADEVTLASGTYYTAALNDRGTVASVEQTVTVGDNQKAYYAQDFVTAAATESTTYAAGTYGGVMSVSTNDSGEEQRWTAEVYLADNDGYVIDSGITSNPVGALGVRVVVILDTGIVDLVEFNESTIPVTGELSEQFNIAIGQRFRFHAAGEKVGTAGGTFTLSFYAGSARNTYIDIPLETNTNRIVNKSNVTGATASDALNALDTALGLLDTATYKQVDADDMNMNRADKYLAAQNIANMLYTGEDLTKIQYNTATDTDYEVLTYGVDGLSNVAHYVDSVLAGNTVLTYTTGELTSAVFTGV